MQQQLCRRYPILVLGVYFCALGVSLITTAGLGTSPIAALAYVMTFLFPLSLGTFTFLSNSLMLFGQVLLLGRAFRPFQLLQLPVTLVFGIFIDLNMYLLRPLPVTSYPMQLLILLLGSASLGLGIALEVVTDTLMLPADGMATALVTRFRLPFARAKISSDVGMLALACIVSFATMGKLVGVREGTLIAALTIGLFAGFFKKQVFALCFDRLRLFAPREPRTPCPAEI